MNDVVAIWLCAPGQALGKGNELLPDSRALYRHEGAVEGLGILRRQKRVQIILAIADKVIGGRLGVIFEEELNGHAQCLGDRLQPARANAVYAFFILLDLLEGNADPFGKSALRQPE